MSKDKYLNKDIKKIVNDVIEEINIGKSKIFNISDKMRDEFEIKKLELEQIKEKLKKIIEEVDELKKLDKLMRIKLVEASHKIMNDKEEHLKTVYEEALDIRVKYITKQNEEKDLILKRNNLEISLKDYNSNIEEAESAVNQINIALGYLEGNILEELDELKEDEDINMINTIKILENQEVERRRIARDIHDGPTQYIANAVMRLDFSKTVIKKDLEKGLEELDDVKDNMKMALKEVRGIIYNLRPLYLEEKGLNEAIKELINNISLENNIKINSYIQEFQNKVEDIVQIATFRIVQEILNNVKKHSKAQVVDIKINYIKEYIFIYVEDDGVGFDVKETLLKNKELGNSYGLIGIYERVKSFYGKLEIKTNPNEGTIYKIKLPINRKVKGYEEKQD